MQVWEIVAIIALGALVLRMVGYLKFLPVQKKHALPALIVVALISAYAFNWGGFQDALTGIVEEPEPTVTPGATFEAEGSETDANLVYDATSRVFTCAFYENIGLGPVQPDDPTTSIDNVTLSIALYRTDYLPENLAVTKITSTVPTFTIPDSSVIYSPVDKTVDEEWKVAMTPTGVATARNEYTYLTVPAGGTKSVSIVVTLDNAGCSAYDNFDSRDVSIHTPGGDFRVRFVKTGQVA